MPPKTCNVHPPLIWRFEQFVMPEPMSGCWLWVGARDPKSQYGKIGTGPHTTMTAHRASWLLFRGLIPEGLWVLHECDVRPCVNPDHLYLGDVNDNSRDLMARGKPYCWNLFRHRTPEVEVRRLTALRSALTGAKHHRSSAKLTESQVLEILAAGGSQQQIAQRFGVCQQLVSKIKTRQYWRHLNANSTAGLPS